jgi:hypothetical protein
MLMSKRLQKTYEHKVADMTDMKQLILLYSLYLGRHDLLSMNSLKMEPAQLSSLYRCDVSLQFDVMCLSTGRQYQEHCTMAHVRV